ncbi:MAG: acetyl-CoA decarbonylase/synthase complex subunit delta [Planctomycetes bacterium B3_Pla]|nr:MAG: acetyl-CoA decarbonylase/synthase complex subunit delta [Planctomycetes bacterium B3_Pla]
MPVPEITESYAGSVNVVALGATKEDGGTRSSTVTVGGARNVVYGGAPEDTGEKPVVAMDVLDSAPTDWPDALVEPYKDVLDKPADWAKKCVEEFGAELICIKFEGIHPDKGDKDADHAVKVTEDILKAVGVPLVLWGCGNDEKDNKVMPKVSGAAKGEKCLIGAVTEDNYKSLTAIALADGHYLITLAPLDINIAKQVNILASDMGFPLERIVTFQSTGALGYGIEYAYSIQERQRLAALTGDKMMAMPAICDVGYEAWRAKEAKIEDAPGWGETADRGPMWETATATCLLQAGVDIIRMRHPRAVATVKNFIDSVWRKNDS